MSGKSFHTILDEQISRGVALLPAGFVRRQVDYVLQKQTTGGGFPGRLGGPDIYYTDFAARLLNITKGAVSSSIRHAGYIKDALKRTVDYANLYACERSPKDIVECFNLLNLRRIVRENGIEFSLDEDTVRLRARDIAASAESLRGVIERHRCAGGGFSRAGDTGISLYNTFLGLLCCQMLDGSLPAPSPSESIQSLRCPGGGYRESQATLSAKANATAAGVASLAIAGAVAAGDGGETARFLSCLQADDGGLRSHSDAACSDLLSTFTGLVTLRLLGKLGTGTVFQPMVQVKLNLKNVTRKTAACPPFPNAVNLASAARFVKSVTEPDGGFRSCTADTEADIEYTYYGLAALGLLKAYAADKTGETP